MRVLMTTDAVGGVWDHALDLSRGLAARGVGVVLAVLGPAPSKEQRRQAAQANAALVEVGGPLEWTPDPWRGLAASGKALLALTQAHDPDVVHLTQYVHGALPWGRPVLVAGHSCLLSWWEAVRGPAPPPSEWGRYAQEVQRGLAAANLVVAPTQAMLDALRRHHGVLGATSVVPNGLEPPPPPPQTPQPPQTSQPPQTPVPPPGAATEKEPFVLAGGRLWDEAKGMHVLARAARGLPWPVVATGPAQPPEGAGEAPSLHGLRLLGHVPVERLHDLMARAAVYAGPASYEPFGLGALRAAHAGCALVLGDIPSLREVWGDAARFVPPGDAIALRVALRRLLSDDEARAESARRAAAQAGRYTVARMTEGYLDAYRRVEEGVVCAS